MLGPPLATELNATSNLRETTAPYYLRAFWRLADILVLFSIQKPEKCLEVLEGGSDSYASGFARFSLKEVADRDWADSIYAAKPFSYLPQGFTIDATSAGPRP